MSDINWDLAPHKAVELVQYGFRIAYRDAAGNVYLSTGWEYSEAWDLAGIIATRPQPERKTVEDLVEWNKSEGFGYKWKYEDCDVIVIYEDSFAYSNSKTTTKPIVCTREEFEACVAAKSGPKWTHTCHGDKCRLLDPDKDCDGCYAIKTEYGAFELEKGCNLKPIKPTITNESMKAVESFAYALMDKEDYNLVLEVKAFREAHDITN